MISLEVGKKYLSRNGNVVEIVHIEPTRDADVRNCLGVVRTPGNDRHVWEQCRRPTAEELKNA